MLDTKAHPVSNLRTPDWYRSATRWTQLTLAEEGGVDIRTYRVIYQAVQDIENDVRNADATFHDDGSEALLEFHAAVNPQTAEPTNAVQMRVGSVEDPAEAQADRMADAAIRRSSFADRARAILSPLRDLFAGRERRF